MTDNDIETLLEAHEAIIVEREEWKHTTPTQFEAGEDRFVEGNVNGLNEARNQIEEMIQERAETVEQDVIEHFQAEIQRDLEAAGRCGGDGV